MKVLNLVLLSSMLSSVWCGVILYDPSSPQSSHKENNQNAPIININNQQQTVIQTETSQIVANQLLPKNLRGDYGSLSYGDSGHFAHGSNMVSNFKAGGTSSYRPHSVNRDYILDAANYESAYHLGSSFSKFYGVMEKDMSTHQRMKKANLKFGNGHNFGYSYNMLIHAPNQIDNLGSSSYIASSDSKSTHGVALAAAAISDSASSSSAVADINLRPGNHRF